jgi:peptidoglycan/LPS O-acetylase OafA/YrhL
MILGRNPNYRPEIDGLRAIAVVSVILYHAGFRAFQGGYVGVDVFFVISGYLITRIIHEDLTNGAFRLSHFFMRRVRRIIPALLVVLVICTPFAYLWLPPEKLKEFADSLLATNLFVSNFLFWSESGYFAADVRLKPLIHMWSLSVEEQFYIVYPIFLLLLYRYARRWLVFGIILGIALSFATAEIGARYAPSANFFLLPSRGWELLAGAFLGVTLGGTRLRNPNFNQLGSLVGIALVGFAVFSFDEIIPFPGRWTVIPVLGTLLIIACAGGGDLTGRVLSSRAMVTLGLVSFSAYLWHQPLFAFAKLRMLHEPSTMVFTALTLATFVLAFVTYRLVELPCRRADVVSSPALVRRLAVVTVFVLALGITGHEVQPARQAQASVTEPGPPPAAIKAPEPAAALTPQKPSLDRCYAKQARGPECVTSTEPDVLIWGDSFVGQLVRGIIESKPDAKLLLQAMSGCAPILDVSIFDRDHPEQFVQDCVEFNRDTIRHIREIGTIRHAILSAALKNYLVENKKVSINKELVEPSPERIAAKLIESVEVLKSLNISVTVVSPAPEDGRNIGDCLAKLTQLRGNLTNECDISYRDMLSVQKKSLDVLERLERAGIRVVYLKDLLCNETICQVRDGELPLYHDDVHLSRDGQFWLGRKFSLYDLFVPSH